jgi:hypothetical protein
MIWWRCFTWNQLPLSGRASIRTISDIESNSANRALRVGSDPICHENTRQ